jgi:glyoxylase-like metal-dependent hydrolase (beta-lactamase superfamily II)
VLPGDLVTDDRAVVTPFAADSLAWDAIAVRFATRETRKSDCYLDYHSYGEPDEPLRMDYFFYVLRSATQTVLVDVGFDPVVGARRGRTCLFPPLEGLERLGVEPQSVSHILLTHLHYDHVGNLRAFPDAELVVHERELGFWLGPLASRPVVAAHVEAGDLATIVEARDAGRVRVLTARESAPLSGVVATCVGGHCPGQLVLTVNGTSGPVVLASDAAHYYEELERDRPFAILVDLVGMYEGYETVRALAAGYGAPIVPGHDPVVMERFPALAGATAPLGVRLS